MKEAVRFAHAHGVRVHVTVNTMPRNDEVARLPDYLATLEAYGVDALIVADVGVLALARQYAPHVPKHISTQARNAFLFMLPAPAVFRAAPGHRPGHKLH